MNSIQRATFLFKNEFNEINFKNIFTGRCMVVMASRTCAWSTDRQRKPSQKATGAQLQPHIRESWHDGLVFSTFWSKTGVFYFLGFFSWKQPTLDCWLLKIGNRSEETKKWKWTAGNELSTSCIFTWWYCGRFCVGRRAGAAGRTGGRTRISPRRA